MEENQAAVDTAVPSSIEHEADQEKYLPQSHVNKIVQREKEKAALRARREAEEEFQRRIEEINTSQQNRNQSVSREIDADALYQQFQERMNKEMHQRQLESEFTNVANTYLSKMQQGSKTYTDFDEVTKDFDPTAFPQIVYLVAGMENAADVIYELSRNPSKLATIDSLAQRSPAYARKALLELSGSIMDNQKALQSADKQASPAPLDRLQPSRISGSNGKMSVSDLRSQDWLRG